ncbi:MAG: Ldh family oxidoreductase [Verrucomicrobia bacterium]|nr:Ldh family oxidoreductase [Verrucomicrobiota bacterium]MBU1736436.1 Ldh family oxidoreductase [Verrucomicrobiota bacterium]MBU1857192.1 Ldh family oxidoreductase [Verrucomicrobiota bacterium]
MQYFNYDKLFDFGVRLLTGKGVPKSKAEYISGIVVDTEAIGITTHGVAAFQFFDNEVGVNIDPKAAPKIIKEKDATALIDGNSAFGQLSMKLAKELAVKKAKKSGIAMIGVRNGFWLGALATHLISLVEQGFFAQLWAQNSTCKDCAPYGGIDPRFSTNPVALAFPTNKDPMIADISTAAMSMSKVNQLIRDGRKADDKLFLDKDGNPTDDPNAFPKGGTILFFGGDKQGYKGYAFSLWCEALTAMAGGDCNNPGAKPRQSFNLLVIDPEAFAGMDYYQKEMKRFIEHVKSSRVRKGFSGIRIPGDKTIRKLNEAKSKGIPLGEFMIEKLTAVAVKNNLSFP